MSGLLEYSIYPAFIYNPERKKVLNHFLLMDRIFKPAFFGSSSKVVELDK
jgi:hypothetical protein